jgi:hypothetical protein
VVGFGDWWCLGMWEMRENEEGGCTAQGWNEGEKRKM